MLNSINIQRPFPDETFDRTYRAAYRELIYRVPRKRVNPLRNWITLDRNAVLSPTNANVLCLLNRRRPK